MMTQRGNAGNVIAMFGFQNREVVDSAAVSQALLGLFQIKPAVHQNTASPMATRVPLPRLPLPKDAMPTG